MNSSNDKTAADDLFSTNGTMRVRPMRRNGQRLPLLVEARETRDIGSLVDWVDTHRAELNEHLLDFGAILFRNFDVEGPRSFERVSLALEPGLQNDYLGTSPREPVTDHVFEASGLPGYYPIPQHCEMTFVKEPPRRLFFSCMVEPERGTGQTPLVDFRTVHRQMNDDVLRRFVDGGIRIVRNYSGPNTPDGFDLWELKKWHEIFGTDDHAEVERVCKQQGFEVTWREDDRLRLVHDQDALEEHPDTGETVWFNHSQVFHLSAAPGEFKRIFLNQQTTARIFALWQASLAMVWAKRTFSPVQNQSLHCTYRDGSEIPLEDMEHVRDVIWNNMVTFSWRRGDMLAIDNFAVSHGRLPYRGPREVVVAWA